MSGLCLVGHLASREERPSLGEVWGKVRGDSQTSGWWG